MKQIIIAAFFFPEMSWRGETSGASSSAAPSSSTWSRQSPSLTSSFALTQATAFVPATTAHLSAVDAQMKRIQDGSAGLAFTTTAAIVQDVKSTAAAASQRIGIGYAGQPPMHPISRALKRERSEERSDVPSLALVTLRSLVYRGSAGVDDGTRARLLLCERPFAVAYLVPAKWALLHVVIVPRLDLCGWQSNECPASWSKALSDVPPPSTEPQGLRDPKQTLRQCVSDVLHLRDEVCKRLSVSWMQLLSRPAVRHHEVAEAGVADVRSCRWAGEAEVQLAAGIFNKKRPTGAAVGAIPLKVGILKTQIVDTFDMPALHVMSADGVYCQHAALLWNAVFQSAHFVSVAPAAELSNPNVNTEKTELHAALTAFIATCKEVDVSCSNPAQFLAFRKSLQHCADLLCPLCRKAFRGTEEVAKHWLSKCLPCVASAAAPGQPLFL